MGSKTLVAIALILIVAATIFVLDTTSLLNPILERLSLRKPETTTYTTALSVDGYADKTDSPQGHYRITYSVSNKGNATAENVTLTTTIDGENKETKTIPSLPASDTANYSLVVQAAPSELHIAKVQASCNGSADTYSFAFGADVPRTFSDNPEQVKLFVTPKDPNIITLKNDIVNEDSLLKMKDWIALRDWVGNNIQYKHDQDIHGTREYWQFAKETVTLKTGDCEDFSILLCSLLRSAGYTPNDVYIVIGKNQNGYHAWVKINLETIGWYNIEPQENGFATLVGDFLTLSDYQALYEFNDQQFHQLN